MLSTPAGKSMPVSDTQEIARKTGRVASKKVWLPKAAYEALPYFYVVSGLAAFLATLYISEWFWVLPHYLLFSAGCLHLGISVLRRRHNQRANNDDI